MDYLNLYKSILLVSILPVMTLFIVMWIHEREYVLRMWGIGTIICASGILCSIIGDYIGFHVADIGTGIYYIGECIELVACYRLLLQKTNQLKKMHHVKKYFFSSITIFLVIIAITGWSIKGFSIFLGCWYIIGCIMWEKGCQSYKGDKFVLSSALILHGVMLILIYLFDEATYIHLLVGIVLGMTDNLLAMAVVLIYYQTKSEEVNASLSLTDEIMQNIPIILEKVDCEGNILYSNKRLRTILGYEEDWVKMSQIRNYMHEKDRKQMRKILDCLKPDRKSAQFQFRLKHYKEYYIWVGLDINPILNKDGIKIGNVVCCKDMTTEKITYMDLMKSQRKFYQLFHGIQDAIFIAPYSKDYVHSCFNQFNKAACENFGYAEDECKEMCLADFDVRFLENKDTRQGKSGEELIQTLFKDNKVIYETEYRTKSGKLIPVEVVDYKFTLNNKDMIMTVVRDISERNIIKETKALEKLKSEFLANVAHELRTPLNVIIITLQSIEIYIDDLCKALGKMDDKGKRYIEIMKQNALRLLKLVNNFLCMAKIESGYYETNKQNYNIVSLVEDISDSVLTYIQDNEITFEFDTDVEEKVVSCDVEMIEKIILNLISNAVKFTAPGGILLIDIKDEGDKVAIIVTDSGRGIPKNKQKVVFERFRQADKTFTRKQEGCGIGLSLVKYFVKEHGGTIRLESEEGLGTSFIIELPAFLDENTPYLEYNFDAAGDTLYKRALEFSDIIHRKAE